MTSLVHRSALVGLATPRGGVRAVAAVRAAGHVGRVLLAVTVAACLLAGVVLLVALSTAETGARIPHPVPLPAPHGQSLSGS